MNRGDMSLERLSELPLPPPPSWMPQTWGWLLIATVIGLALLNGGVRRVVLWRRNRYRREALACLDTLHQAWVAHPHDPAPLRALPVLLKRVALSNWPRAVVARLSGSQLQTFLQAHSATPLPADFAERLANCAYAADAQLRRDDAEALFAIVRHWLETHRVAT